MTVEQRLTEAFRAADQYEPSPDLFVKVTRSIEEDAAHRRRIRRVIGSVVAALGLIAGYLLLTLERVDGAFQMPFWALEVLVTAIMTAGVLALGPAIRHFGTAFEGDVFRSNHPTGRSFLTLMDIAYYLIFGAYIFMTLRFSPPADLSAPENLDRWLGWEVERVAGLLLLMGLLHVVTLMVLPVVGLVFSANMRRARREGLGDAAPPANPDNEQLDLWITIVVWTLVGIGLLALIVAVVLPAIVGLAG